MIVISRGPAPFISQPVLQKKRPALVVNPADDVVNAQRIPHWHLHGRVVPDVSADLGNFFAQPIKRIRVQRRQPILSQNVSNPGTNRVLIPTLTP